MNFKKILEKIPELPGVYLMKDNHGNILYVGKASNLKRRVSSYFMRTHDAKTDALVLKVRDIDFRITNSVLEALILESKLIKKFQPLFNIRDKDDKSFLFVDITREKFPRVLLVRGKGAYGPFISSQSIREALRIIRKIFPYSLHPPHEVGTLKRPCFDAQIGLCPGVCVGATSPDEYRKTITHINLLLRGEKKKLLTLLRKNMREASENLEFENAEKIRKQVFALQHIYDVALLRNETDRNPTGESLRIEGYDVSDISGASAVGSMVVFYGNMPVKSEYRKFRIRSIETPNDVGMLKEVLERRFHHREWMLPDCILIDGGKGQVNICREVLKKHHLDIPVLGIMKGPQRKRNDILGKIPKGISSQTLIRIRDEAHRFAIQYHKKMRKKKFLT